MVRYLLDTNTISYAFRGEGGIARRLLERTPADFGIPAPVLFEARAGMLRLPPGARRDAMLAALDRLLATVPVVPFDAPAAESAALIRADLEARGAPIGPLDTQIAGIARSLNAVLVTRNLDEFGRVGGLATENWYDSAG